MIDMDPSKNDVFVEFRDAMNSLERAMKRLIDIIASFCGIIVLSPILLLVWILILLL